MASTSKNVFVYPVDGYVGRAVAEAFTVAGHSVSGVATGSTELPVCSGTIIRANDDAAHKQLLLTADIVVYDMHGHERATREAVVHLAQQPYGGREVLFVGISSPLVWAATRPNPEAGFAGAGEWGILEGGSGDAAGDGDNGYVDGDEKGPSVGMDAVRGSGTGLVNGTPGLGASSVRADSFTGGGAGMEYSEVASNVGPRLRPSSSPAPSFSAPEDVSRRSPSVSARQLLAAEQAVMRGSRRGRLRTAVVCPGLLYGHGEDEAMFLNAFKAAWMRQCVAAAGGAVPASGEQPLGATPRAVIYGRGTNVLPTLHVADLATYVIALAGLAHGRVNSLPAQTQSLAALAALPPAAYGAASPAGGPWSVACQHTNNLHMPTTTTTAPRTASPGVAALPATAPTAPAGGGYFLVTDGSRCSQAEVVRAIVAGLGLGGAMRQAEGQQQNQDIAAAIECIPEAQLHLHSAPPCDRMLLDLALTSTVLPPPLPGWAPAHPGGLPAHVAAVATEFVECRRLTPLRLLVVGPPLSGKTHLARRLAHRYGLIYMNVPLLLAAAADATVAAAAGLSAAVADPALLRQAQAEVAAGAGSAPPGKESKDAMMGGGSWGGGGRVSARTLGLLLAAAVSEPRSPAVCRGFVLDGFPRSAAQARAALYRLEPEEGGQGAAVTAAPAASQVQAQASAAHAKQGHKGAAPAKDAGKGGAAAPASGPSSLPLSHPSGVCGDVFDVPQGMRLVANPLTAPTHVLELSVPGGEEELRARLAALEAAAEEETARLAVETSTNLSPGLGDKKLAGGKDAKKAAVLDKKVTGGAKDSATVGATPLGHTTEGGLSRRLAAYRLWRAEDDEDLAVRVAVAQAAWEMEQARCEDERARLAAENSKLKAKRKAAKVAAGKGLLMDAPLGGAAGMDCEDATWAGCGSPDGTIDGTGPGTVPSTDGAPLMMPQHGGLVGLCVDCGAAHCLLANPTTEQGPLVTVLQGPGQAGKVQVQPLLLAATGTIAAAATAAAALVMGTVAGRPLPVPPALVSLERQVEAFVGRPHNFNGFPSHEPRQSTAEEADVAEAEATATGVDVQRHAAEAVAAERGANTTVAVTAGAEASYQQRLRGRGSAAHGLLVQRVMGVLTAALSDVALAHGSRGMECAASPAAGSKEALLHVARALQAAAAAEEEAFLDPYLDDQYGIQLAKIEAKAAREGARAAAAEAKAERENAARQQQAQD